MNITNRSGQLSSSGTVVLHQWAAGTNFSLLVSPEALPSVSGSPTIVNITRVRGFGRRQTCSFQFFSAILPRPGKGPAARSGTVNRSMQGLPLLRFHGTFRATEVLVHGFPDRCPDECRNCTQLAHETYQPIATIPEAELGRTPHRPCNNAPPGRYCGPRRPPSGGSERSRASSILTE